MVLAGRCDDELNGQYRPSRLRPTATSYSARGLRPGWTRGWDHGCRRDSGRAAARRRATGRRARRRRRLAAVAAEAGPVATEAGPVATEAGPVAEQAMVFQWTPERDGTVHAGRPVAIIVGEGGNLEATGEYELEWWFVLQPD